MKEIKKIGKPKVVTTPVNKESKNSNIREILRIGKSQDTPQQENKSIENQLTRPLPSNSVPANPVQKVQDVKQGQIIKPAFMPIARDQDQVYDATHGAKNDNKRFNMGGGIITYIIIIAVSVLVSLLVGNFQYAPYSNYKKDITRLEMDLVDIRNTIKSDEGVSNSTRTQVNSIGTNVGNINTQITGMGISINDLKASINNVNNTLAGQIVTLNNSVNNLQSVVNASLNRSVNK